MFQKTSNQKIMFPKMTMIGGNASSPATTINKTNKRTSSTKWILAYGIAFCALAAWMITVCDAKPAPVPPQELADALKVLQQLDRYYSQVARPRSVLKFFFLLIL